MTIFKYFNFTFKWLLFLKTIDFSFLSNVLNNIQTTIISYHIFNQNLYSYNSDRSPRKSLRRRKDEPTDTTDWNRNEKSRFQNRKPVKHSKPKPGLGKKTNTETHNPNVLKSLFFCRKKKIEPEPVNTKRSLRSLRRASARHVLRTNTI